MYPQFTSGDSCLVALTGILAVREAMWEELVLRRDLSESPNERVRHERMQFEEMVESYAKYVLGVLDSSRVYRN